MAPPSNQVLLSPAELSYLHTSLSLSPPIRPDGRSPTQFRPLVAETDLLPGCNGSARICFPDGTEAVVGIKAGVEKTATSYSDLSTGANATAFEEDDTDDAGRRGENAWVQSTIEIPGYRDDDALPVFLAALLHEALLADEDFTKRLWINRRYHWKLYIDILLLSPPLSYPLPLLSLTTHLALLSTRIPRLKSELDEDPLFDDDWEASRLLYLREASSKSYARPPVTLLVMAVGDNVIFDPSKEELAVAEVVLAVSVGEKAPELTKEDSDAMDTDSKASRDLRLLCIRTIDPPSRLTPPGVPNALNSATGGSAAETTQQAEAVDAQGVWQPPRGGAKRKLIAAMVQKVLEKGGVAEEVLDGLDALNMGY